MEALLLGGSHSWLSQRILFDFIFFYSTSKENEICIYIYTTNKKTRVFSSVEKILLPAYRFETMQRVVVVGPVKYTSAYTVSEN